MRMRRQLRRLALVGVVIWMSFARDNVGSEPPGQPGGDARPMCRYAPDHTPAMPAALRQDPPASVDVAAVPGYPDPPFALPQPTPQYRGRCHVAFAPLDASAIESVRAEWRARNGAAWAHADIAVDSYAGHVWRARFSRRREDVVVRNGLTEEAAVAAARELLARNGDLLGLTPGQLARLEYRAHRKRDDIRMIQWDVSAHIPGANSWSGWYEYHDRREPMSVSDWRAREADHLSVMVEFGRDDIATGVFLRSRRYPQFELCESSLLPPDSPLLIADVIGRRITHSTHSGPVSYTIGCPEVLSSRPSVIYARPGRDELVIRRGYELMTTREWEFFVDGETGRVFAERPTVIY